MQNYGFFLYLLIGVFIFLFFLSVEFNNMGGKTFIAGWVNFKYALIGVFERDFSL